MRLSALKFWRDNGKRGEKGDMIHIAVMGFGTVGAGVAEILQTNGALLEKRLG